MPRITITAKTLTELFQKLEEKAKDRAFITFNDHIEGSTMTDRVNCGGWNPRWDGKKWKCSIEMSESVSTLKRAAAMKAQKARQAAAAEKARQKAAEKAKKEKEIADLKKRLSELEDS